MIDRHMRDLRLDRRLQRRRGWISAQEFEEAAQALPDVATKGEIVTDEEAAAPESEARPAASEHSEGF
jgi:hypothetical protein